MDLAAVCAGRHEHRRNAAQDAQLRAGAMPVADARAHAARITLRVHDLAAQRDLAEVVFGHGAQACEIAGRQISGRVEAAGALEHLEAAPFVDVAAHDHRLCHLVTRHIGIVLGPAREEQRGHVAVGIERAQMRIRQLEEQAGVLRPVDAGSELLARAPLEAGEREAGNEHGRGHDARTRQAGPCGARAHGQVAHEEVVSGRLCGRRAAADASRTGSHGVPGGCAAMSTRRCPWVSSRTRCVGSFSVNGGGDCPSAGRYSHPCHGQVRQPSLTRPSASGPP